MSSNPINLAVRFLLEISALASMSIWGWDKGERILRFVLAIGIPLIAATIWGTFRVPNDPKNAPVAIPDILRLVYEVIFFGFATWVLFDLNFIGLGWTILATLILHYALSYDRIAWLLKQ
jgi:F0F1-type ATP synthase assembly protein I